MKTARVHHGARRRCGAFLAKHPDWESTINRYAAAGLIALQPRERRRADVRKLHGAAR